jgi:cytochrome c oxidase subunit II
MSDAVVGLSNPVEMSPTIESVTPTSRLRRMRALAIGGLGLLLAGCAQDAPQDIFQGKGDESQKINSLTWVFYIAVAVAIIVGIAVVAAIVKFREKPGETRIPKQIHGNLAAEITWTAAPALLLAVVGVFSTQTLWDLQDKPEDCIQVNVVGQQWWWEYEYPAQRIVTANDLVLPAGRAACLSITSRDVIHSFWIPALNGKKDAVPGRIHRLTMQADEPGRYWGQCTEFCGLSHANMRMLVRALPEAEWNSWVEKMAAPKALPTTQLALDGEKVFAGQCASCHQIQGLRNAEGNPFQYQAVDALIAGAAPNLTHLKERSTFAGATWELYSSGDPYDPSKGPLVINREQLEAWLRNSPEELPMAAGQRRGMPALNLTNDQIDQLVAYLMEEPA